jgi:hypothetical protein
MPANYRYFCNVLLIFIIVHTFLSSATATDPVGQVTPVDLSTGRASITLDFTEREYELILYTGATGTVDTSRSFSYQVQMGNAASKLDASASSTGAEVDDRGRLEAGLRLREQELAAMLKASGGWQPPLRRPSAPQQAAASRTFIFEQYGNVTSDRSVSATLVASTTRALGYLDDALATSADNVSQSDIQDILDQFTSGTYDLVTSTFGEPSDVDGNGKVIFLFTHLVDQVGDVAGFYASGSLFDVDRGGDGNLADMMYISPTRPPESYQSLLAHEYQHLINFYQHAMARDGDAEETWLNEALSHYTEDLVDGHIAGGNAQLVDTYLQHPGLFTLTSDVSPLYGGNRGAAYLFLRGLVDEYGTDLVGNLVQTDRTGVPNAEAASGRSFDDLLGSFSARLFLSGTGVSSTSGHNYTYRYLTEPQTGYRSMPLPAESSLTAQGASTTGYLKPASPAYVRLSGSGQGIPVEIQVDASGSFSALLIALDKHFVPNLALPVDFFQGLTLDSPFPGVFVPGEPVTISGSAADSTATQAILEFSPLGGATDEISFQANITGGRFSKSIVFASSQAGTYRFLLYAGPKGESLPEAGRFSGVVVREGGGAVELPSDYFPGITLDAAMPTEYDIGQPGSLAGSVTDQSLKVILLVFAPQSGGDEIRVQTTVSDGRIRKGFVFTPLQTGTYDLSIYGGSSGGQLPYIGGFSPVTVSGSGSDRVWLPVDAFDKLLFDEAVSTTHYAGSGAALAGQVTDPAITQIAISFTPDDGGAPIDSFWDVTGSRFRADISFNATEIGTYEMTIYGGAAGQSLPYLGDFSPVLVVAARPEIEITVAPLAWAPQESAASESKHVTIRNYGSVELTATASVAGVAYTVDPSTLAVGPGDSARVTVTFTPAGAGTFADVLTILTNDPDKPSIEVALSGTATAPAIPTIGPTDFNGDGITNFADFITFAQAYGTRSPDAGYNAIYDLNADGSVGFLDFIIFAQAYGS